MIQTQIRNRIKWWIRNSSSCQNRVLQICMTMSLKTVNWSNKKRGKAEYIWNTWSLNNSKNPNQFWKAWNPNKKNLRWRKTSSSTVLDILLLDLQSQDLKLINMFVYKMNENVCKNPNSKILNQSKSILFTQVSTTVRLVRTATDT